MKPKESIHGRFHKEFQAGTPRASLHRCFHVTFSIHTSYKNHLQMFTKEEVDYNICI